MKRIIISILILVIIAGVAVWSLGLVPVARVNGENILRRAYTDRAAALVMFEEQSRAAAGRDDITLAAADDIRQSVLQNLISEAVFRGYIEQNLNRADLEERSRRVVDDTLGVANPDILPRATKQLYGWSVEEFTENVLFPQALQNELAKDIEQGGTPFEEFARTQLSQAEVKLYFVPWKWENGALIGE